MSRTVLRWGLTFGVGIAAVNLLLEFFLTKALPWQLIGVFNLTAWLAGTAAAGGFAGRASGRLKDAALAAVVAAVVDDARGMIATLVTGLPAVSPAPGQPAAAITPGLLIAGYLFLFVFIAGLAALIGVIAGYLARLPGPAVAVED